MNRTDAQRARSKKREQNIQLERHLRRRAQDYVDAVRMRLTSLVGSSDDEKLSLSMEMANQLLRRGVNVMGNGLCEYVVMSAGKVLSEIRAATDDESRDRALSVVNPILANFNMSLGGTGHE